MLIELLLLLKACDIFHFVLLWMLRAGCWMNQGWLTKCPWSRKSGVDRTFGQADNSDSGHWTRTSLHQLREIILSETLGRFLCAGRW